MLYQSVQLVLLEGRKRQKSNVVDSFMNPSILYLGLGRSREVQIALPPDQLRDVATPVCPESFPGRPRGGALLPGRHLEQMPNLPQLSPFVDE